MHPQLDTGLACLLRQEIQIDFVIAVLNKDRFTPISALRYVVRETDNHRPG